MSAGDSGRRGAVGIRSVLLLVVGVAAVVGFRAWQSDAAGKALGKVAREFGLTLEGQGRRQQLRGRIDGFGVRVDFTPENRAGETRYFTDFSLHAPGAPPGRIVGAGVRERAIAGITGAERIATGDPAFDDAVFVMGEPGPMLAHLDAEARAAVRAAAAAGWVLEDGAWSARKSGLVLSAGRIRSLLELGLGAARAARFEGDVETALRERAANDPIAGTRAAAGAALAGGGDAGAPTEPERDRPMDAAAALATLEDEDPTRALEAALVLAEAGDDREAVRQVLIGGLLDRERQGEVIAALARVGGPLAIAALGTVKGEHEAVARAAIAEIEARR